MESSKMNIKELRPLISFDIGIFGIRFCFDMHQSFHAPMLSISTPGKLSEVRIDEDTMFLRNC